MLFLLDSAVGRSCSLAWHCCSFHGRHVAEPYQTLRAPLNRPLRILLYIGGRDYLASTRFIQSYTPVRERLRFVGPDLPAIRFVMTFSGDRTRATNLHLCILSVVEGQACILYPGAKITCAYKERCGRGVIHNTVCERGVSSRSFCPHFDSHRVTWLDTGWEYLATGSRVLGTSERDIMLRRVLVLSVV